MLKKPKIIRIKPPQRRIETGTKYQRKSKINTKIRIETKIKFLISKKVSKLKVKKIA